MAIVDPETWVVRCETSMFFEWFGPDAAVDAPLGQRIEGLGLEAAAAKLEAGRRYTWETDVTAGSMTVTAGIELRRLKYADTDVVLVEARNIS